MRFGVKLYTRDGETLNSFQWAKRIGVSPTAFNYRLRKWGPDDPRTWRPGAPPNRTVYEWGGFAGTVTEWARRLGIGRDPMLKRIKRFGPNNPRTFAPPSSYKEMLKLERSARDGKEYLKALSRPPETTTFGDSTDRRDIDQPPELREIPLPSDMGLEIEAEGELEAARLQAMTVIAEEFPQIRDDTDESIAIVVAVIDVFGQLSNKEIAVLLDVSRQRVDQLLIVALKRLKMVGGKEMREHYEASQDLPLVDAWGRS